MPYFSVEVHGQGIQVAPKDVDARKTAGTGESLIIGFYAFRIVWADSPQKAEGMVLKMINDEWTESPYAEATKGNAPQVTVESVSSVGFFKGLTSTRTGYAFYQNDNGVEPDV